MVGNSLISRMVSEVISSICSEHDHDVESSKVIPPCCYATVVYGT